VDLKDDGYNYSFGMDQANALTIAFWVKITGHHSATEDIIGRNNNYGPNPFTIRTTSTKHIQTYVGGSTLTSTAVIQDSVWNHVALTYRDSSRALYLNGVKDQGGSNNLAVNLYFDNDRTTRFGASFIGILDEVRFYNRALSADEIAHLAADTTNYATAVNHDIAQRLVEETNPVALPNPSYNLNLIRANPQLYRIYDLAGRPMAVNAVKTSGIYLLEVVSQKQVQKVILLSK
jgi:hypothetical protein